MSLAPGTRLGPYEITAKLGEGGMGVVFKAKDFHLGREVALKVLPEGLTADPERAARFEREAKLLASLNHPNIAQVYGLEVSGATRALVMELVEGPTLAERVARGPLPLDESLSIARQIAEALEEAHEKGIIHRDLKPQNIKASTGGKVKVLDFGLAKAFEAAPAAELSPSRLAHSPTITLGSTREGVILGTAAYMSPEQAKGLAVDKRADIWAFGVVLYEMLVGERLFAAASMSETLAAVLTREVELARLPATTPPRIRGLLRRCLARDPRQRLHDIGDARLTIEEALAGPDDDELGTAPRHTQVAARRMLWTLAAVAAVAVAAIAVLLGRRTTPEPPFRGQFEIHLPAGRHLDAFFRRAVAISPDGRTLAVITSGDAIPPTDQFVPDRRIELRAIEGEVYRPLVGTEGALELAFSPDGRSLVFSVRNPGWEGGYSSPNRELRKVSMEGGRPTTLCAARAGFGLSWGASEWIAFAGIDGPIYRVRAEGGTPEPVTRLDEEKGEISHRNPLLLPDGRTLLFSESWSDIAASSSHRLYAQRIGEPGRTLLATSASDPRFVAPDQLLFARDGKLFRLSFDPESLTTAGDPSPIAVEVAQSLATGDSPTETGQAQYDVAANGLLVAAPGSISPGWENEIVRVDTTGRATPLDLPPAPYLSVRLSPDGALLLLSMNYPGRQIEVYDLERGSRHRVTSNGNPRFAIWGPKRHEITFVSDHEDEKYAIYRKTIDDTSLEARRITELGHRFVAPSSWSPSGDTLAFVREGAESASWGKIWLWKEGAAESSLSSTFDEMYPDISPDGQWLVYTSFDSFESGPTEVWVQPFGRAGAKQQVSVAGGFQPAWSRDGRWIYFTRFDFWEPGRGGLYRVSFTRRGEEVRIGRPERLFPGFAGFYARPARSYDVTADGEFYLIRERSLSDAELLKRQETVFPTKLRVLVGLLDRGVPAGAP